MNEFTASNGIPVSITSRGYLVVDDADAQKRAVLAAGKYVEAIAEFFRAREDDRLGRWRWPEAPDFVVYPDDTGCDVLYEPGGGVSHWTRAEAEDSRSEPAFAARAYFDAHPEQKPAWHDATHGEAWVLTVDGIERAARVDSGGRFVFLSGGMPFPDAITAGRRIYPEVAS